MILSIHEESAKIINKTDFDLNLSIPHSNIRHIDMRVDGYDINYLIVYTNFKMDKEAKGVFRGFSKSIYTSI